MGRMSLLALHSNLIDDNRGELTEVEINPDQDLYTGTLHQQTTGGHDGKVGDEASILSGSCFLRGLSRFRAAFHRSMREPEGDISAA